MNERTRASVLASKYMYEKRKRAHRACIYAKCKFKYMRAYAFEVNCSIRSIYTTPCTQNVHVRERTHTHASTLCNTTESNEEKKSI